MQPQPSLVWLTVCWWRSELSLHCIEILAMTQPTVFPRPEQAEILLRRSVGESTHSGGFFYIFLLSLLKAPAALAAASAKNWLELFDILHPTNLTLSLSLGSCEFRFYSLITRPGTGLSTIYTLLTFYAHTSPPPPDFRFPSIGSVVIALTITPNLHTEGFRINGKEFPQ